MEERDRNPPGPTGMPTVSVSGTVGAVTLERNRGPALGTRLGAFRVEARLGEGGLGIVYRAYDEKLKRPVALKVLAEGAASGARLLEEARRAAALMHPSIAAIHDVQQQNGVAFIVMELVEGTTLRTEMARGPLAASVALRYARSIAAGLARAHRSGVVHRDLKPENVMVTPEGETKILDFGLARDAAGSGPLGDDAAPSSETGIAGTPDYMSPEQARGRRVDARSDVFSFGVVLYEILAGARPFARRGKAHPRKWGGPESDDWRVVERLAERAPGAPSELVRLVERCLELTATARFADGAALVVALRDVEVVAAPPARGAWRGTVFGGVAFAALVVAAGAAAVTRASPRSSGVAGAATSASAAPAPSTVRITDLPVPASDSSAAVAAYTEGLSAERDGNNGAIRAAFRKATAADPSMAAAWLRLALVLFFTSDHEGARGAFGHATALASRLDEHDRALLHAAEPLVLRDPPDWDELTVRLRAAVERFAADAELLSHYGYALYRRGRWAESIQAYDSVLALDAHMGDPYLFLTASRASLGDPKGALAIAALCEKNAPASSVCTHARLKIEEQLGDCAAVEADGRAEAMRDPASDGYASVAEGLASEGKPPETVKGAVDLWTANIDAAYRAKLTAEYALLLAVYAGDFTLAERRAHELETMTEKDASENDQAVPLAVQAMTLDEEGRGEDARRVAERFLKRQPSWLASDRYAVGGLSATFVPAMMSLARGGMAPGELEERRDAWARDWAEHMKPWTKNAVWFPAYAAIARDAADAKRALAALASYSPLPAYRPNTTWDAAEGYVYLLAGDAGRALPLLEKGANVCLALSDAFGHMQALLHLGMAREATGDTPGACEAYGRVTGQWGKAKPRSTTASEAADRVVALGCPGRP